MMSKEEEEGKEDSPRMMGLSSENSSVVDFDDLVLSDVHLGKDAALVSKGTHTVSKFMLKDPLQGVVDGEDVDTGSNSSGLLYDDDGDIIVKRRSKSAFIRTKAVTLCHRMATPLADVGKQVWKGAFLMSDWILHNSDLFQDQYCFEFGGGVGMCSIVAAMNCKHIFCTDMDNSILCLCQKNVEGNEHLLRYGKMGVKVKKLNWLQPDMEMKRSDNIFGWLSVDLKDLKQIKIFFAADVIYDNSLTDALFSKIIAFMEEGELEENVFFVSVEKRLNFTIKDLDIACPAYEYFLTILGAIESGQYTLQTRSQMLRNYKVTQIKTDFPKYFEYERVNELELWQIKSTKI